MSEPKFTLRLFGAPGCPACQSMARARTLEKMSYKHFNVEVEKITLVDEDEAEERQRHRRFMPAEDSELEPPEEAGGRWAEDWIEEYGISTLPLLVLETRPGGEEILRREGQVSLEELEGFYEAAVARLAVRAKRAAKGVP